MYYIYIILIRIILRSVKIPYFSRASENNRSRYLRSGRGWSSQSMSATAWPVWSQWCPTRSQRTRGSPQRWKGAVSGEVGGCLAFCFMGFSRCCPFLMSLEVCGYMILIYKLVGVVNTHGENQQIWWLISKKTHIFEENWWNLSSNKRSSKWHEVIWISATKPCFDLGAGARKTKS